MSVQNDEKVIKQLGEQHNFQVKTSISLAGGSINRVYLLRTSEGERVIKINSATKFPGMFAAEKAGLDALKIAKALDAPEVFAVGQIEESAYLLLEYKKEGSQKVHFWEVFGQQLAQLHRNTSINFGFPSSNYIGSLAQYNNAESSAADFYIHQRLEPQIKMASERGFLLQNLSRVFKNIALEIPNEPPALIHGDLWSGNYLVNQEGLPCLIDPAVCYGPREMDLAMMKLFGGFPEDVFQIYHSAFPLESGWKERLSMWQLYYLLVHLNIFGSSYLPQVKKVIAGFS
ncbi:fructosamine kinase family protein [Salinimicrobium sp. CDJ15-91]|uniref:Fructosamine kinase family protein n=2 Tax=Salinimicrobium oceani TaxID=2722702 RepID=A0ABX1CZ25_9FLAO|nr:fructosamine kinase family protein [Salinimicrobium oceani]